MRQAFIWTNDGLVYWRIDASLGLDESEDGPCKQSSEVAAITMLPKVCPLRFSSVYLKQD